MSTNFYMSKDGNEETLHLGKRSCGWSFLFKGDHSCGVTDLRSWYRRAKAAEDRGFKLINDNNSDERTLKDLLITIKSLVKYKSHETGYFDKAGNSFYDGNFC